MAVQLLIPAGSSYNSGLAAGAMLACGRSFVGPHKVGRNSFGSLDRLRVGTQSFDIYRLETLEKAGVGNITKLPFSLKILLENLLRNEEGALSRKMT